MGRLRGWLAAVPHPHNSHLRPISPIRPYQSRTLLEIHRNGSPTFAYRTLLSPSQRRQLYQTGPNRPNRAPRRRWVIIPPGVTNVPAHISYKDLMRFLRVHNAN